MRGSGGDGLDVQYFEKRELCFLQRAVGVYFLLLGSTSSCLIGDGDRPRVIGSKM